MTGIFASSIGLPCGSLAVSPAVVDMTATGAAMSSFGLLSFSADDNNLHTDVIASARQNFSSVIHGKTRRLGKTQDIIKWLSEIARRLEVGRNQLISALFFGEGGLGGIGAFGELVPALAVAGGSSVFLPTTMSLQGHIISTIREAMMSRKRNRLMSNMAEGGARTDRGRKIDQREQDNSALEHGAITRALIKIAKIFYNKNWLPGTAGNLSHILTHKPLRFVITAAGLDKGNLSQKSFVEVELTNGDITVANTNTLKPSGETILHTAIYECTDANCIIHVHSSHSLLIAELFSQYDEFAFRGYEVQKGLGFSDISQYCRIPIFDNKTNLELLSQDISTRIQSGQIGFLIKKHGLFVWGRTTADAKRHVELLHHIFEYELLKHKFQGGK